MANAIDDALDRLANALEPVLPGRVHRTGEGANAGPNIAIGVPGLQSSGGRTIEADFPVTISYDGADRAQVAGLNDIVARSWDACERLSNCTPLSSRPLEAVVDRNIRQRIVVITVRMLIAARTLCAPDVPNYSPIPPEPIPV